MPTSIGLLKKQESSRKTSTSAFDFVDHHKLWKILQEMGIPDHLTCFLRNLYADDTTLMAESEEELKSLLTKMKEENEKAGLKLNVQ